VDEDHCLLTCNSLADLELTCGSSSRISNHRDREWQIRTDFAAEDEATNLQKGRVRIPAERKRMNAPESTIPCRIPSLVRSDARLSYLHGIEINMYKAS
jgi:hypothetical protein